MPSTVGDQSSVLYLEGQQVLALCPVLKSCPYADKAVYLQTFVKVVNYQHLMPTRYTLDVDLKGIVTQEALDNSTKRTEARKVSMHCVSKAGLGFLNVCFAKFSVRTMLLLA